MDESKVHKTPLEAAKFRWEEAKRLRSLASKKRASEANVMAIGLVMHFDEGADLRPFFQPKEAYDRYEKVITFLDARIKELEVNYNVEKFKAESYAKTKEKKR